MNQGVAAEPGGQSVPAILRGLRVALVHDYLNQQGGAENVLLVLAEMFPDAPIYTSVYDRDRMPQRWQSLDIRTSFMQRISPRMRVAKMLLPLYPTAFESFDLRQYDLVLSSTTAFAKGVMTQPRTCHVSYCHNTTRFLWMYHTYVEHERFPPGALKALPWLATAMRSWDFIAAQRVDHFIAGSHNAARRIAKYYRRDSDVVQPPIDCHSFHVADPTADHFLVVSRLQPYKRIDLAVQACSRLGLPLRVIGRGPDEARLRSLAGPTVRFLGHVSDKQLRQELSHCRALIFPGEEDFGLTPLEAQASGRPVIAYGAGGALETVVNGQTGVYFAVQSVDCLAHVLSTFRDDFDPRTVRAHSLAFDVSAFKQAMYDIIARRYSDHQTQFGASTAMPASLVSLS